MGIAKLNLDVSKTSEKDNGNYIGLKSTYETNDGASHSAADVWFVADTSNQPPAVEPDMRTRVVDFVQAISAFEESAQSGGGQDATKLQLDAALDAPPVMALGTAVNQMSDVLKQFDANGQQIGGALTPMASSDQTLRLNALATPQAGGILASK